jgi:hypothetical protein
MSCSPSTGNNTDPSTQCSRKRAQVIASSSVIHSIHEDGQNISETEEKHIIEKMSPADHTFSYLLQDNTRPNKHTNWKRKTQKRAVEQLTLRIGKVVL